MKKTGCNFISRTDTALLQAVAVSLMVWHHLFGFPERIAAAYFMPLGFAETLLAYFGRICVAMFAFLSGYGMQKKQGDAGYRDVWKHLLKFYRRYWAVFLVFVPLGLVLGVYGFQRNQMAKGLLGLTPAYNAEWWYISSYLKVMLLFPLIRWIMDWAERRRAAVFHGLTLAVLVCLVLTGADSVVIYFIEGMYFARTPIFEWIGKKIPLPGWLTGGVLVGAVFILRTLGVKDDMLVPAMIMGTTLLARCGVLRRPLLLIGKYSTYIWLTHTFFAYYYFQKLTYLPWCSWLVFLWCMALCLAFGMAAENVLGRIEKMGKEDLT